MLAQCSGNGFALFQRFVEKALAPGGRANHRTEFLIFAVIGAQLVAVGENQLFVTQRQDRRFRQQGRARTFGKGLAKQKITVAMHDRKRNAGICQGAKGSDNAEIEGILRIINAIIARPGFKQVAKNIEMLGSTGCTAEKVEKVEKNTGDTWH